MNALVIPDVVVFEIRRSLTLGRSAIWMVLVLFPVAMVAGTRIVAYLEESQLNLDDIGMMLYILIPEMICMLGLLLWASPAISTEVEGQTWIYLAMRRTGRTQVPMGKYVTSVVWTLSAAIVSITLCWLVMGFHGGPKLWLVLSFLSLLSCVGHAALYLLIGVIAIRRSMVAALVYTFVVEYGLALVPAMVNKLTINYWLRGMAAEWIDGDLASFTDWVVGSEAPWIQVVAVPAMTFLLLVAVLWRMSSTEFPVQQDG